MLCIKKNAKNSIVFIGLDGFLGENSPFERLVEYRTNQREPGPPFYRLGPTPQI